MLSMAIDPDLLIYRADDINDESSDALNRLATLAIHRRFAREYEVQLVISSEMAALLYELSCWNSSTPDFRDLNSFFAGSR